VGRKVTLAPAKSPSHRGNPALGDAIPAHADFAVTLTERAHLALVDTAIR